MRRHRALFHRSFNAKNKKTLVSMPSLSLDRDVRPDVFSHSLDGRLGCSNIPGRNLKLSGKP